MMRSSRALGLRRLALRVIEDGDSEAATVLGDALMEMGVDKIETGRVREARFVVGYPQTFESPYRTKIFFVRAKETLYNVDHFARAPSRERWVKIFTMWVTSKRAIYDAMRRQKVLPYKIGTRTLGKRFADVVWETDFAKGSDLGFDLFDSTVRIRHTKRPMFMFPIHRSDMHGRRTTAEVHFDRIPMRDPKRRRRR